MCCNDMWCKIIWHCIFKTEQSYGTAFFQIKAIKKLEVLPMSLNCTQKRPCFGLQMRSAEGWEINAAKPSDFYKGSKI